MGIQSFCHIMSYDSHLICSHYGKYGVTSFPIWGGMLIFAMARRRSKTKNNSMFLAGWKMFLLSGYFISSFI